MADIERQDLAARECAANAKSQRQAVEKAKRRAAEVSKSLGAKGNQAGSRADRLRVETRLALISPSDKVGLERVIGTRDIVAISYLHRALVAARSVCRIRVVGSNGEPPIFGTGFLIAPGLLVTNHHVLQDEATASCAVAEFNYELDLNWVERQRHFYGVVPTRVFFTDPGIDITIVAIAPVAQDGTPVTEFGTLKLIPNSGKALEGECVSIIQHPQGEPKQVVMRENRIIQLDAEQFGSNENFIHYTSDTEAGSSGSPVFNDQWDLVAVHHKSLPDFLPDGQPKNRTGKVWTPEQGEGARSWIANEGVRVSAMVRSILVARDDDPHAARIAAILAFEPPTQMRSALRGNDIAPREEDPSAYPELPSFESTRFTAPAFQKDAGFESGFLGKKLKVELPKLAKKKGKPLEDICFVPKGAGSPVLDYTHFSLVMHKTRKLALWTAVNIDGAKAYLKTIPGVGWRKDKRAEGCETFGSIYGKNRGGTSVQIDKGHQVRRLDPVWGPKDVAERAAADTFHYTNAVPQEHFFNSELWGNLEDFVLERAINKTQKASVFTGPVLRSNDPLFEDARTSCKIPKSFWKICAFIRSDGTPSVTGFVMEQTDKISPLFEANRFNPFTVDEVRVYQKPIAEIELLTGLDFGDLKKRDKMGVVETTVTGKPRPIRRVEDIVF
jgi:endonuclease G